MYFNMPNGGYDLALYIDKIFKTQEIDICLKAFVSLYQKIILWCSVRRVYVNCNLYHTILYC